VPLQHPDIAVVVVGGDGQGEAQEDGVAGQQEIVLWAEVTQLLLELGNERREHERARLVAKQEGDLAKLLRWAQVKLGDELAPPVAVQAVLDNIDGHSHSFSSSPVIREAMSRLPRRLLMMCRDTVECPEGRRASKSM